MGNCHDFYNVLKWIKSGQKFEYNVKQLGNYTKIVQKTLYLELDNTYIKLYNLKS